VNALAFTLFDSELRREKEEFECHNTLQSNDDGFSSSSQTDKFSSDELENWQFAPEKGNVIFVSALDCWGFGLMKFAKFWSKKFGVNQNVLTKYLFDDYVFNQETKKIIKNDASNPQPGMNPMFVTMVLEPIWSLYEHGVINNCPEEAVNIAKNEVSRAIPLATCALNSNHLHFSMAL
jgi:ribosome assembly protein 1